MALKDFKKALEKVTKDHAKAIVAANANTLIHKITFDSPQLTYMFGGFSYDRIHNLFGPESSGKSSTFSYIAGQLQKKIPQVCDEYKEKQVVVYMDFERTFDPNYANKLGLNTDEDHFVLLQSDTLEEACAITEELVKTNSVCCVILDSDAAAPTNLDAESEIGATGFNGAKAANTLKEVYKRFNVLCSNYKFPLLVVSQERANMQIGAFLPSVTGGTALKFFSSTRCRVQKMEQIKNGDEVVGIQIRVRNYKNKTSVPNRDAIMNLYFDGGFKSDDEYFEFLTKLNIIEKCPGGVYKADFLPDGKIRGAANLLEWITQPEQKELYAKLKEQVTAKLLVNSELDADNVDPEKEDAAAAGIRLTAPTAEEKAEVAELAKEALEAASTEAESDVE